MHKIYLSGAIHAHEDGGVEWRRVAGAKLKRNGFEVIDPHDLCRGIDPYENDESRAKLIMLDLDGVTESHAILLNASEAHETWGSPIEVYEAYRQFKPTFVFANGRSLSPWLTHYAHRINRTMDGAILSLVQWFNNANKGGKDEI